MGSWMHETKQATRRLLRAPTFTAVSVATIGVGIGAFTSIFSMVEAVLLEPMPYEEPEQLAWVWRDYVEADFPRGWLGAPDVVGLRQHPDVFDGVAALRTGTLNLASEDGTNPVQIVVNYTTHELFDVLGVQPELGRSFTPEEGAPEGPEVAVLSHDLWRRLGSDQGIVGNSLTLNGLATEVIGVMPRDFRFVKHGSLSDPVAADLYLPLQVDLTQLDASTGGSYAGLVRVRPDAHPDQVTVALSAAAREADEYFRAAGSSSVRLWTVGLQEDLVKEIRPALTTLVGAAGFLLLILAANLATLLLSRAAKRQHELGIRTALGAGRSRILMSVWAECAVIAVAGGLVGIGLSVLGVDLVVALAPEDLPRLGAVGLDPSVLVVALGVTALMAFTAGLTPSLHALRASLSAAIKEGGVRAGGGVRGARIRNLLVAAQVALSLMLLVGGGLTARAFAALLTQDPGFDSTSTLTFRVPLPGSVYQGVDRLQFHDGLRERIGALPGVVGTGASTALPLTQLTNQQDISFPGAPGNVGGREDDPLIDWFRVTPGYFSAAGHRLIAGRDFVDADGDSATFSMVIDDVLANRFFPDGSAVGSRAALFGDTATIIGVVDQARLYNVHADDRGQAYVSFQRFPTTALSYAVRTEIDPTTVLPAIRAVTRELDSEVPLSNVRTLESIVHDSIGKQRLSLTLILTFALGALVLATLGIYGVVSSAVVRRTQEIGVRMALGARSDQVVGMVVGQGLRLAVLGAAVGLLGATATSRVIEGVMVGVEARDPITYVFVAMGVVGLSTLASYLPARRATRIDPVNALRPE